MSRPTNCACNLPSCVYCNHKSKIPIEFQRMFRDWRDDEIDRLSTRVKELELELSTTLRDVAANTAPLDMVEQLRKENKCLIKIIEDRDVIIAESYETNAENHQLRDEVEKMKQTLREKHNELQQGNVEMMKKTATRCAQLSRQADGYNLIRKEYGL